MKYFNRLLNFPFWNIQIFLVTKKEGNWFLYKVYGKRDVTKFSAPIFRRVDHARKLQVKKGVLLRVKTNSTTKFFGGIVKDVADTFTSAGEKSAAGDKKKNVIAVVFNAHSIALSRALRGNFTITHHARDERLCYKTTSCLSCNSRYLHNCEMRGNVHLLIM